MNKGKARLAFSTVLASGAAWLAITSPAFPSVFVSSLSPPPSLDLQTQATLQAKGARVLVPVAYSCPKGLDDVSVSVSVNQRAGRSINSGYGSLTVVCTGEKLTTMVPVDAEYRVFKKGTAAATANLDQWYWDIHLTDFDEISIK